MKKDIDQKNCGGRWEANPLQLIAHRNDPIVQVIAQGNDGVFYALNLRKSVR